MQRFLTETEFKIIDIHEVGNMPYDNFRMYLETRQAAKVLRQARLELIVPGDAMHYSGGSKVMVARCAHGAYGVFVSVHTKSAEYLSGLYEAMERPMRVALADSPPPCASGHRCLSGMNSGRVQEVIDEIALTIMNMELDELAKGVMSDVAYMKTLERGVGLAVNIQDRMAKEENERKLERD